MNATRWWRWWQSDGWRPGRRLPVSSASLTCKRGLGLGLGLDLLLVIVIALAATTIQAQTAADARAGIVDLLEVPDAGTLVMDQGLSMRWRAQTHGEHRSMLAQGQIAVRLRLDVAPWMGQDVRIYAELESAQIPSLELHWRSADTGRSGVIRQGQQALYFAGPVARAILEDSLAVTFVADGRELVAPTPVRVRYRAAAPRPPRSTSSPATRSLLESGP